MVIAFSGHALRDWELQRRLKAAANETLLRKLTRCAPFSPAFTWAVRLDVPDGAVPGAVARTVMRVLALPREVAAAYKLVPGARE